MEKNEEELGVQPTAELIAVPVEEEEVEVQTKTDLDKWHPKTSLGKKIKAQGTTDINQIFDVGTRVMEVEIIDALFPDVKNELLLIGQAKGKFGGGQRRIFRQTQKKTNEGNKPHFGTLACVGNENGYVGTGYGKSKETVPSREKAVRKAKLNLIKIRRGCGSWQCFCKEPHSIPYRVSGRCGSVRITLLPAPKGTGLRVDREVAKILRLAGIRDIWSETTGQTRTKINLISATMHALMSALQTKIKPDDMELLGVVDGKTDNKVKVQ